MKQSINIILALFFIVLACISLALGAEPSFWGNLILSHVWFSHWWNNKGK